MDEKEQQKINQTLSAKVRFIKEPCRFRRMLGTQDGDQEVTSWQAVEDSLHQMFRDEERFVTLTAGDIRQNIRYVQSVQGREGILVQLGVEESDYIRLVEKVCSEEECLAVFREFYDDTTVQHLDRYRPVEFFV